MPVTNEVRVVVGERGESGLKVGDVLTIRGRSGALRGFRELHKNMELTLQDDSAEEFTRRLPLDSEVNVIRTSLTDEERMLEQVKRLEDKISTHSTNAAHSLRACVTAFTKKYEEGIVHGNYQIVDLDLATRAAAEEEKYHLWTEVLNTWLFMQGSDVGDKQYAAVRALITVRLRVTEQLTKPYQNALSRSTSTAANLTVDIQREAQAEWLYLTKHMGVESMWEQIGGVL